MSTEPNRQSTLTSNSAPTLGLVGRTAVLFTNFFLIILAYYHIKPASRSLFIEYLGADQLPYVWIGTAVVLGTVISYYHRLVERHTRLKVVLGTCLTFIGLLVLLRILLGNNSAVSAIAFYISTDIFSVVLVEQFWSLTNTIYTTKEGKCWYGLVGTGGLVGGVISGMAAALLLEHTPMETRDLPLVGAGILGVIFGFNLMMGRLNVYQETPATGRPVIAAGSWRTLLKSRYLQLIAAILLLAQLAAPLVEFQFSKMVEAEIPQLDARTEFLSRFFSILSLVAIGVNLLITPLVHRYLGVMAGLLTQPLILSLFCFGFLLHSTLLVGSGMKISDRGLSYSINRASKELLYVPVDPVCTYQAKAWIDMFGYRMFKVLGSLLILALTQWLPGPLGVAQLSWFTMFFCFLWSGAIAYLAHEYRYIASVPEHTALGTYSIHRP